MKQTKKIRNKKIVVIHSGGMDSSICLAHAVKEWGAPSVLAMSFTYNQRHSNEIQRAQKIADYFGVDRVVINIDCLAEITENALIGRQASAQDLQTRNADGSPKTLVLGRNGLMARLGAIHAHSLGAHLISMGVIGVEAQNSGYRDCTRSYMDKMQEILRLDLNDAQFAILTPLVHMSKKETYELALTLGGEKLLQFLLQTTITCYDGIDGAGCKKCFACTLRNEGLREFMRAHPTFISPIILDGE